MITPEAIIKVVCDYYHVEKDIVIGKRRFTEHVRARHLAMYFCKKNTFLSLDAIGSLFDGKHDKVLHAIKSVNNQVDTDKIYRKQFSELTGLIKKEIDNIKWAELLYENEVFLENNFYI